MHFVYHRNMQDIADIPCGRDPSLAAPQQATIIYTRNPNDLACLREKTGVKQAIASLYILYSKYIIPMSMRQRI